MSEVTTKQEIVALLEPLLAQAEREGKWLHCSYQDLWFSPKQLRERNAAGRFLWGPVNWTLRDPHEKLADLLDRAASALKAANDFRSELEASK